MQIQLKPRKTVRFAEMSFEQERSRLGVDVADNMSLLEEDVISIVAEPEDSVEARVERIRQATGRAMQRMDESMQRTIEVMVQLPTTQQQEQLTDLWEEAANTVDGVVSSVFGKLKLIIMKALANVTAFVKQLFRRAIRTLLAQFFGF